MRSEDERFFSFDLFFGHFILFAVKLLTLSIDGGKRMRRKKKVNILSGFWLFFFSISVLIVILKQIQIVSNQLAQ